MVAIKNYMYLYTWDLFPTRMEQMPFLMSFVLKIHTSFNKRKHFVQTCLKLYVLPMANKYKYKHKYQHKGTNTSTGTGLYMYLHQHEDRLIYVFQ